MNQQATPVGWAQHRTFSKLMVKLIKPRQPAVLILSLPRSGSSWAGEALGCAIDALYLREPITQSDQEFYDLGTVFALDQPDIEQKYRQLADRAFAGWPNFHGGIVRFPEQWGLPYRRPRRVVIKEVNPLACSWYVQHYQPRLVFLVRHPAAVALSWQRNGWLGADAASWAKNGEAQGRALREVLTALGQYPAQCIALYEDLCANPLTLFQRLFEFAGLTWDASAERFIAERINRDDNANTWSTSRNSQEMIHGWRKQAVQAHVAALRETYRRFELPWYGEDEDWVV